MMTREPRGATDAVARPALGKLDPIGFLLRIGAAIRRRWQQAGTERALHELDARTLRDVGIDRSEIPSMAAEWHGAVSATRIRALRYSPHSLHG